MSSFEHSSIGFLHLLCLGCAQYIEWNPLRATPISLPNEAVFVIANSLAEANKAASSDFNERVVECRMGCRYMIFNTIPLICCNHSCYINRLIAKKQGLAWQNIDRFALLQRELNVSLEEMEVLADRHLHKNIYVRDDIIRELEISETELNEYLSANTKYMQKFKLRQRALHVFQGELMKQITV